MHAVIRKFPERVKELLISWRKERGSGEFIARQKVCELHAGTPRRWRFR